MVLSIKNPEAEKLARELAKVTHQSITQAVLRALQSALLAARGRRTAPSTRDALMEISERCAGLPDLDTRSPEEILGYDDAGVFDSWRR